MLRHALHDERSLHVAPPLHEAGGEYARVRMLHSPGFQIHRVNGNSYDELRPFKVSRHLSQAAEMQYATVSQHVYILSFLSSPFPFSAFLARWRSVSGQAARCTRAEARQQVHGQDARCACEDARQVRGQEARSSCEQVIVDFYVAQVAPPTSLRWAR